MQYGRCSYKRGNLDTDMHKGRVPGEDESRVWGDVSTSQGTAKFAGNPESQERAMPDTFILGCQSPELRANELPLLRQP